MVSETRSLRLEGTFELLSPLSHIGETISTTAYLSEEPVLQGDGSIETVFAYSGNAWRGQLRDLAAAYMLRSLGNARVPLPAFHLLFSGGSIGGKQSVDIEQARMLRRALPIISLWGGGVGNQILPGKLRVGVCYPLCLETERVVPDRFREDMPMLRYRTMTTEKSFSRSDDEKDERLRGCLEAPTQDTLLLGGEKPKKGKTENEPPTQMRYTVELLIAGSRLYSRIDVADATDVELGCLVSALDEFATAPYIGGQARMGHGLARLVYTWSDPRTGEGGYFLGVDDGRAELSEPAAQAKDAYDSYLRTAYQAYLETNASEMQRALEAVK